MRNYHIMIPKLIKHQESDVESDLLIIYMYDIPTYGIENTHIFRYNFQSLKAFSK